MATVTSLMTAEDYAREAAQVDGRTELVRGRMIVMPPAKPRHGQVCGNVCFLVRSFVDEQDLGHVLSNDSGVITERDPDTVRGADVAYYSYEKVPRGPFADEYLSVPPDLVFEVLSPDDRPGQVLVKVGEYLDVGVQAVCVLDPAKQTAQVYRQDRTVEALTADDDLSFPGVLDAFRIPVRRFFA